MAAVEGVDSLNLDFSTHNLLPTDRPTQGKGCNRSCSAGFPRKRANSMARSRAVRVGKVVHPCRVKSIRIAVSAVMDDLELMGEIIENMN